MAFLTTPESKAKNVPEMFEEQYPERRILASGRDTGFVLGQLKKLKPDELTPEHVESIIGNGSWTRTHCEVCDDDNIPVVTIRGHYGYGDITLCKKCFDKAGELWPS